MVVILALVMEAGLNAGKGTSLLSEEWQKHSLCSDVKNSKCETSYADWSGKQSTWWLPEKQPQFAESENH